MSSNFSRRPNSASHRTFIAQSDISSNLSRAQSAAKVQFEPEVEKKSFRKMTAAEVRAADPSVPKGSGAGLGLPEFLQKRALMPKVEDPMADAFAMRLAAGSLKKADPKAPRPVEVVFKLK